MRASGEASTVLNLLRKQARDAADRVAIEAPGRRALKYGELLLQVEETAAVLRGHGISGHDRIAIVMPNGPEMAVAFLGVSACAASAPLNPNYRRSEFEFYLQDLDAKALVVLKGSDSDAVKAADTLGIPVIALGPDLAGAAGRYRLPGRPAIQLSDADYSGPSEVALVLHTSGTTAKPKQVPLTHRNLSVSAENIRHWLGLTEQDRCLNVMPLFHIHGLVAALLASIAGGASVVCAPGFYASDFASWLDQFRPTWYTAVPTMHQAILAQARQRPEAFVGCSLRFVRSSSSALPPQVAADIEKVFGAPVIEAYGMTEAAHQMASNPLPPRPRKFGTVGLAAGPEVAVMTEDGELVSEGQLGELVIRGPNVMGGYVGNPEANASAFADGWFRTGDQGHIDGDGYITITGRLKEIINRGGEKISPREVDEVLLDHPAVAQVVTFSVPDERLGEAVAAAVVLNSDASVGESDLRRFSADRLTDFKVPAKIVFLDELPKGPTGKLQRVGLAERLGIPSVDETADRERSFVAPSNSTETKIAALWQELLRVDRVGVHDYFLELGGDSMQATRLVSRLRDEFRVEVPLLACFDAPTVAEQAVLVDGLLAYS